MKHETTLAVLGTGVLLCTLGLSGCAAGRLEGTGEVVWGVRVASLPETTGQFLGEAAGLLPGVGPIAKLLIGAAGAAGIFGSGTVLAKRAAAQRKIAEDAAWDESQRAAELSRQRENAAFDEGHARASGPLAPAQDRSVEPVPAPDLAPPAVRASVHVPPIEESHTSPSSVFPPTLS